MNDADERFARRLREEVSRTVGPAVEVGDVEVEWEGTAVRLAATCTTPAGIWIVRAGGQNLVDTGAALVREAAEVRVAIGFRQLVEAG